MHGVLTPVLSQLITLLVKLAAGVLFAGLIALWRKLKAYLQAHLTHQQMKVLSLLGREGYVLAETAYRDLDGPSKLQKATAHVEAQARLRGIPINDQAVRAAIESAWMEAQGLAKQAGSTAGGQQQVTPW